MSDNKENLLEPDSRDIDDTSEVETQLDLDEQAIEMLASAYYWEIEQGFRLKSKAAEKAYGMAVAEYASMKTRRTLTVPTAEELKELGNVEGQ